jgi:hypothetical protein
MQLALPYLETLDYVERYCWYQPNSGVADYYDASGTLLTNVGTFYQNQASTPSIPESTLSENSNLDIYYTLDVNEFDSYKVSLVPNPSKGIFSLKTSIAVDSYLIYNIQGQLIKSKYDLSAFETEIDLTKQMKGIYFLNIKYNNGTQSSKKLIVY